MNLASFDSATVNHPIIDCCVFWLAAPCFCKSIANCEKTTFPVSVSSLMVSIASSIVRPRLPYPDVSLSLSKLLKPFLDRDTVILYSSSSCDNPYAIHKPYCRCSIYVFPMVIRWFNRLSVPNMITMLKVRGT